MRASYQIGGRKGGGKGGGGKGSGGFEAPNTLRSKQIAKVIDLLSAGPIVGLVDGLRSVYFDGVPVQNADGTLNFRNASIILEIGERDQPVMPGFNSVGAEASVSVQVKTTADIVRTIINPDVDQARVTVSVPALQVSYDNGNIGGSAVSFSIALQSNGGGFQSLGDFVISGKTNTRYQRAYVFDLTGSPPWDIRLHRITADSVDLKHQNDLYWDTLGSLINAPINYNGSAVVGLTIDAEQFDAIPKRGYQIDGRIIRIPSNYDPRARTYAGVWDGTFILDWSNNPAWVLLDVLTDRVNGLGQYIGDDQVDLWGLYAVAKWADEPVDDGKGGTEPRWIINAVLADRQEAYDLVTSIASVLRANVFWGSNGKISIAADRPLDPVKLLTNANVLDGVFRYAGADWRAAHNFATVSWNDPAQLGEPRVSIVEDQDSIAERGLIETSMVAIGATSEGQAVRTGRWTLFTETRENETVTFSVGFDGAWFGPGDVVEVADRSRGGLRRGGRIMAAELTAGVMTISLDAPLALTSPTEPAAISCYVGEDAHVETQAVGVVSTDGLTVTLAAAFATLPKLGSVYVVSSGELQPTLWRVFSVKESNPGQYEIQALAHHPGKWDAVESNIILETPITSVVGPVPDVANLNAVDYLVALTATTIGTMLLVSWTSSAPFFEVRLQPVNGVSVLIPTAQTSIDVPVTDTDYDIEVTPIDALGRRGSTQAISHTVIGQTAPPQRPLDLRMQVISNVGMLQWQPTPDLDVKVGGSFELRYSPRTDGSAGWDTSNVLIASVPGIATTVETPYRPGTYFLKARDASGLLSTEAAQVITVVPSSGTQTFHRICEDPEWSGLRSNIVVQDPTGSNYLIIGPTGGLWDDQAEDIDTWLDVDVLPFALPGYETTTQHAGLYYFSHEIDLGAPFLTTLTTDMLAFPYVEGGLFIDDRPDNVDTWQNWDEASGDLVGRVYIQVRSTRDDPTSPTASWSPWSMFTAGQYEARGFQFRSLSVAPIGQNVAIENLCILADISNKVDNLADQPWTGDPDPLHIAFNLKFYEVPSISVLIRDAVAGDHSVVTDKTTEGFDLSLQDNANHTIDDPKIFDVIASGY